jgi:hypothetical protein
MQSGSVAHLNAPMQSGSVAHPNAPMQSGSVAHPNAPIQAGSVAHPNAPMQSVGAAEMSPSAAWLVLSRPPRETRARSQKLYCRNLQHSKGCCCGRRRMSHVLLCVSDHNREKEKPQACIPAYTNLRVFNRSANTQVIIFQSELVIKTANKSINETKHQVGPTTREYSPPTLTRYGGGRGSTAHCTPIVRTNLLAKHHNQWLQSQLHSTHQSTGTCHHHRC